MGISLIDKAPICQVGTLTGKTGYTAYEFAVRKCGNIVHVKGYITKDSGSFGTSQIVIADVTGVALPAQATRFTCATGTYAYTANKCAYGIVDSSGNIHILASNGTDSTAVLNFWYPAG